MNTIDGMKPFGHGFEEPKFKVSLPVKRVQYFLDKISGKPKHTCVIAVSENREQKNSILQRSHRSHNSKRGALICCESVEK